MVSQYINIPLNIVVKAQRKKGADIPLWVTQYGCTLKVKLTICTLTSYITSYVQCSL
uniref:Uncharacterized protein n=1 Tax=Anguilla anguilla TaxID=7936 RepID=A0A0E9QS50_ANGAN